MLERGDFLEALTGRDGVDEQESFAGTHVLLPHGGVLFLSGGIEDIEQGDLFVNDTLLAVRVWGRTSAETDGLWVEIFWQHTLDGRIILVDEMALNQLDRKTRFTDTTSTNDHQLVFSQELLATTGQRRTRIDIRYGQEPNQGRKIMRNMPDAVAGVCCQVRLTLDAIVYL